MICEMCNETAHRIKTVGDKYVCQSCYFATVDAVQSAIEPVEPVVSDSGFFEPLVIDLDIAVFLAISCVLFAINREWFIDFGFSVGLFLVIRKMVIIE